jgi:hypothetical protein
MKKKSKRFVVVEEDNTFTQNRYVLVDRETGVNYLWMTGGYAGGLTVLVDAEGKPIVTPIPEEEN